MIRIATICLLISMVRSQNCSLSEDEIEKLRDIFLNPSNSIETEAKKRNGIICIGAARAGKSTLLNYLIGNKLKGVKVSSRSKITLEKVDNLSQGPEIGAGVKSKTIFPSAWQSPKLENVSIWDSPGFGDNRGPIQDISNTFYLYELVKNLNAFKIVLVVDYDNISGDNIGPFLSLLSSLESFLGNNFRKLFSCISIIFTKVPYDFEDMTIDNMFIKELLEVKVVSTTGLDMSKNCRDFLVYISKNSDRIGLFRSARRLGEVNSDIDYHIFEAIRISGYIPNELVKDIHPSISASSQICLHSVRSKLLTLKRLEDLQNFMATILREKLSNVQKMNLSSSSNETKAIQDDLIRLQNILNNFETKNLTAYEGVELLQRIHVKVEKKIQDDNVLKHLKLIAFVNMLLHAQLETQAYLVVKYIVQTSLKQIKEAILSVSMKIGEITVISYNNALEEVNKNYTKILEDLSDKLNKTKQQNLNNRVWNILMNPAAVIIDAIG